MCQNLVCLNISVNLAETKKKKSEMIVTYAFIKLGLVVRVCSWRDQSLQTGQDDTKGHAGNQGNRDT